MSHGDVARASALAHAARLVARSSRRELVLGVFLVILLSGLAGLFFWLAMMRDTVSTGMLVVAGVASLPALLALWYVASRIKRTARPESSSFYALLAEPDRITSIREQHITYQVSSASVGSEYIVNVAGGGRAGYCRLDAAGFEAIKGYLVAVAAHAFEAPSASAGAASAPVTD